MAVNNSLSKKPQTTPVQDMYQPPVAPQANMGAVGLMAVEKEAKQMEIAMVTAKRFPRDYTLVEASVERNCSRQRLAMAAEYSFPRGGETISGASVRLMEVIAQCYGNIEFGVNEIQRYDGYSEGEAYAWDFENNIRMARKFTVPHFRDTKQGKKRVTDDRDIREIVMNYGARNMRACLERVIPRDLVDFALEKCRETLAAEGRGLADRIANCKEAFKEFEIDAVLLERIIGEKCSNWNNGHLRLAIKYYTALKDGETTKQALVDGLVKTITKAQIDELTGLVGANQARVDALLALGYEVGEIKNIPAVDYDAIKNTIQNVQGGTAKKADGKKAAPKAEDAPEEFDESEFFGGGQTGVTEG